MKSKWKHTAFLNKQKTTKNTALISYHSMEMQTIHSCVLSKILKHHFYFVKNCNVNLASDLTSKYYNCGL